MTTLTPTPIFNPNGNDSVENRSIWLGDTTNLINLNSIRFNWAMGLYNQMRENFWIPAKVDLTPDINDYKELTPADRRAYNGILSYLVFLDSLQVCNLPNLQASLTAPEIRLCLTEQTSQEALHAASYQAMIEAIIPAQERQGIYDYWRGDAILRERCEAIAKSYQSYIENPTPENYFTVLVADYIMEGLYFYNGFAAFFCWESRNLMPGSADMVKYIKKDEVTHTRLFQELIPEAMEVFPHSRDLIYEMFDAAVTQECRWTNHITNNEILGISEKSTEQYTKYLANLRLKAIGLDALYEGDWKNPYTHLDRATQDSKANFFEATVTEYGMSSGVGGWDAF